MWHLWEQMTRAFLAWLRFVQMGSRFGLGLSRLSLQSSESLESDARIAIARSPLSPRAAVRIRPFFADEAPCGFLVQGMLSTQPGRTCCQSVSSILQIGRGTA